MLNPTTIPNRPTELPPTHDVIEFESDNGKLIRVNMRLEALNQPGNNIAIFGQAYEMTSAGNFAQAPNGYPSRSSDSSTTFSRSAVEQRTVTIGPGWVRHVGAFNPEALPDDAVVADTLPEEGQPGDSVYIVGNVSGFTETLWRWDEGIGMAHARVKAEELLTIIASSRQLSGLSFR